MATPADRFEDNGDGTLTDRRLKLMWMLCSTGQAAGSGSCTGEAGKFDWLQAQAVAAQVNQRGTFFFSDWRLPMVRELATLIEPRCSNPRVNLGVLPGTPPAFYWTASTRPGESAEPRAYALSFGGEGVELMDKKEVNHVRLVRSAH